MDKRDRKLVVTCEYKYSDKCKKSHEISLRALQRNLSRNERYICLFCSRQLKFSGRKNPNCKYRFDDLFFTKIDSLEKAYLLGWIASDGHISMSGAITIAIHEKDKDILYELRDLVCKDIPVVLDKIDGDASITFNSKQMVGDLCRILNISPGKKSHCVDFPSLDSDELTRSFIRGYFDGDGSIRQRTIHRRSPECHIASCSDKMLDGISNFVKFPCRRDKNCLAWSGVNALDFLGWIYKNPCKIRLERKYSIYTDFCGWTPSLPGYWRNECFTFTKTREDAVPPEKSRPSDSGYDLTILEPVKKWGKVTLYDTGIKVKPTFGCYFDLVARSSLIKSGYILANGIGIIDQSYLGNNMVPLLKIDDAMPDLELPTRVVQLIPRQTCHAEFTLVDSFEETSRGDGGFGSTGK